MTQRAGRRGRDTVARAAGPGPAGPWARTAFPGGARCPLPALPRGEGSTIPRLPESLTWAAPVAALAPRGERRRGALRSRGRDGGRGGDGGRRRRSAAARPPVPQPQQPAHGADDGAGGQELPAWPSAPAGSPQRLPAPGGPDPPLHARPAARPPHAGRARTPSGTVPPRPRGLRLLRPAPAPQQTRRRLRPALTGLCRLPGPHRDRGSARAAVKGRGRPRRARRLRRNTRGSSAQQPRLPGERDGGRCPRPDRRAGFELHQPWGREHTGTSRGRCRKVPPGYSPQSAAAVSD